MSEQDLHAEPAVDPTPDPEAALDDLDDADELERLDDEIDLGEAPEADAVEQRTSADPGARAEDDYPPH